MVRSGQRRRVTIPSITTRKAVTRDYEFVRGWNSNTSNDDLPVDVLREAIDTRIPQIGKWRTRKGNSFLSVPIGEAINVQQTSVTGAGNYSFGTLARFAKKITATADGVLTIIEPRVRNANGATGRIVLALHEDDGGAPASELVRTTIPASTPTSSYGYIQARSITCPSITNGTVYWVVGYVQDSGSGLYEISTTTNATDGLISSDGGVTWTASNFDFNIKVSTATEGGVKGHIFLKRPNGNKHLFFAHSTSLYDVNLTTGATTAVDTSLNASATQVRFDYVNDILYYVTGFQKPRRYNFTSSGEVGGAPENASNIRQHKGILFYTSASDPSKEYFTNFADYETFTSTDFYYVPAPRTSDPVVAKFPLNGVLYHVTRRNKFVLYGAENATFRLDSAIGQKGTFSQESVAWDEDNAYIASDDGIYRFNGAEEVNIALDILARYLEISDKSALTLELFNNRLYVWYTPVGGSENSRCFVYHTLYGVWESDDTLGYVGRATARTTSDDYLIVGSNRCGMMMYAERSTNDYDSMGEPLSWELATGFAHYDTPAQFKRAPMFRPHFDSISGSYSVQVGYALDYSTSPTYNDISLAGDGVRFDTGVLYNSGALFGGTSHINPMDDAPRIAGQWRRLQLRYKHYAAGEPVSFDGHILSLEMQRMK